MKKKMMCLALLSALGLCGGSMQALASNDEYAPNMEELGPELMEDETLPPGYELEFEETDQPFMDEEALPVEEDGNWQDETMEPEEVTDTTARKDGYSF